MLNPKNKESQDRITAKAVEVTLSLFSESELQSATLDPLNYKVANKYIFPKFEELVRQHSNISRFTVTKNLAQIARLRLGFIELEYVCQL